MGRLGLIAGSSFGGANLPQGDWETLDRHQGDSGGYSLPHEIDHAAHMRTLAEAGCDRVLAIGSVGGLQPQLGPGTFLCPDDFIALGVGGGGTLEGPDAHRVPEFAPEWRGRLVREWAEVAEPALVDGGVYWQATGPRLETRAEIRMAARDADVIGMTVASECVLAGEFGLGYAAICVVDNYANGVGDEPLRLNDLRDARDANLRVLADALAGLLPVLS